MIIDARNASTASIGRAYTFSAAVANALDEIAVHQSLDVHGLIDPMGVDVDRKRLDMMVSKHKGNRRFLIRSGRDGVIATITRLA